MELVSFERWAGQRRPDLPGIRTPTSEVWLHHGGAGASTLATVRAYLRHHVEHNGWATIGYSFVVAEGRVFEGRGPARQGAHTLGRNHASHGICIAGDYSVNPPSQADIDALVWLLRHGHRKGWWQAPQITGGHRDAPKAETDCPGDRLSEAIPEINRRAMGEPRMNAQQEAKLDEALTRIGKVEASMDRLRADLIDTHLRPLRRTVRAHAQSDGVEVEGGA